MSDYAAASPPVSGLRETAREFTGYWWMWLLAGIAWIVVSLVILQFDGASIATIGVLVGALFTFAGLQNLTIAAMPETDLGDVSTAWRWVTGLFGVLFLIAGLVCFINPVSTFVGLADMLGFLFLTVGIWWMVRAFNERQVNSLWWVTLISGILMTVLAFWTSGQFFIEKAYVLLVFAGIWALMEGIADITRAFAARELHKEI